MDDDPQLVAFGVRAALATPIAAGFALAVGAPILADELVDIAGTSRFTVTAAATLAVFILLALALVALYALQEHRLGRGALAGFAVALAGTLLAAGGAWNSLFTLPYLADHAPAILDRDTDGSLLAGYVLSYLVFVVGWASVAVATARAKILPRSASAVTFAGSVLAIVPAPTPMRVLVLTIGVALLGRAAARRSGIGGEPGR